MSGDNQNNDCPEETIAHGDSPFGVVKCEETLARFVLLSDKYQFDTKSGRMRKAALLADHLWEGDGWSLLRQDFDCVDMTRELERHAKEKKGRCGKDYGYALVGAAEIRKIKTEIEKMPKQAICVIDDPQEEVPAHALAKRADNYSQDEARRIRNILLKEFSKVIKS